jgi:hypothetical protein
MEKSSSCAAISADALVSDDDTQEKEREGEREGERGRKVCVCECVVDYWQKMAFVWNKGPRESSEVIDLLQSSFPPPSSSPFPLLLYTHRLHSTNREAKQRREKAKPS